MHAVSIVWRVDATAALADLTEISSQVEAAVVVDGEAAVLASTLTAPAGTDRLARAGLGLLEAAESRFSRDGRAVTQLEVALRDGSIFVAKEGDLGIVARTGAGPSSGLVFYDLRACLRSLARPAKPPRRAAGKKKEQPAGA